MSTPKVVWVCGLTTCSATIDPDRRATLLPRTLHSLDAAGFRIDRLFVDGDRDPGPWEDEFGIDTTCRHPLVRTAVHWTLSLAELYARSPVADRYAMFQDDFVISRNVRPYLDRIEFREKTYWNLYTFPVNQKAAPKTRLGGTEDGFFESNQLGKGAVAIVFTRDGVVDLLSSLHLIRRPQCSIRGWRAIDGGIVDSLRKAGYKELVHSPSPTQHTGKKSSMKNRPHPQAESFRGETFDFISLLPGGNPSDGISG